MQRYQHRRSLLAQARIDDLVDTAMVGIEDRLPPRQNRIAGQILIASLMSGIELGAVGGRLQSITSRE